MQPRIMNPVMAVPDALQALLALSRSAESGGIPSQMRDLVVLRSSQINGCGYCVALHTSDLRKAGETDERIAGVAAWRETTYFSDAERAALALAEAETRLSDRADPVPDAVWDEAARHFDEPALHALVISIATVNTWNRLLVTTRQLAGPSTET